jgi:hypothetical protein
MAQDVVVGGYNILIPNTLRTPNGNTKYQILEFLHENVP